MYACVRTDLLRMVMYLFRRMTDLQNRPRQSPTPEDDGQEKQPDEGQEILSVSTKPEEAEESREEPDLAQEQEKLTDIEPEAIVDELQMKPDPSTQATEVIDSIPK